MNVRLIISGDIASSRPINTGNDYYRSTTHYLHVLLASLYPGTHYDEAKLRELNDGAEIEHARITKIGTVRVYAIKLLR